MSTSEMPRKSLVLIAISALLMTPVVLARGGGGHSGGDSGGGHFSGGGGEHYGGAERNFGGHFQGASHTQGFSPGRGSDHSFSNSSGPVIRENSREFAGNNRNMGNNGTSFRSEDHRITESPQDSRATHTPMGVQSRQANSSDRPGNIFSGKTGFDRSHRETRLSGNFGPGVSRFRNESGRHFTFEDRDRFHGRFHDGFRNGSRERFHHDFFFRDRHHRAVNFIIWPDFCFPVFYDWGPYWGWGYSYPYYCQRYVFVSLGGYWPDYDYMRYYWYPGYMYGWYGYAPVAQDLGNNVYTYNYDTANGITPVNENTFADVRARMNQQKPQPPAAQTLSDTLFNDGVNAFGQGSYKAAADKFAEAMKLSPDDTILPFAYSQAQFADGQYANAADTLRAALQKFSPDKMGVYYPRGLYLDEDTLTGQIDRLAKEVENNPTDSNLQLLLGYQWLGIGETQKAIVPLKAAQANPDNAAAATTLLNLAEKLQAGAGQTQ